MGEWKESRREARDALTLARMADDEIALADACAMMAHTQEPEGRLEAALAWFNQALMYSLRRYPEREGTVRSDIGRIRAILGRYDLAMNDLTTARRVLLAHGYPAAVLTVDIRRAGVLAAIGDEQEAEAILERVIVGATNSRSDGVLMDALLQSGKLHARNGSLDAARATYARATRIAIAGSRAYRFLMCNQAELAMMGGNTAVARSYLARAAGGLGPRHRDLDLLRAIIEVSAQYAGTVGESAAAQELGELAGILAALVRDEGAYRTFEHAGPVDELEQRVRRGVHALVGSPLDQE